MYRILMTVLLRPRVQLANRWKSPPFEKNYLPSPVLLRPYSTAALQTYHSLVFITSVAD